MARTTRNGQGSQKSAKGDSGSNRVSQISRSLTRLLRHGAVDEKIPITTAGWVKMEDLLAWRGLSRIAQNITLSDIFEAVEEDGRTGKGRFEVKLADENDYLVGVESKGDTDVDATATGDMVEATAELSIDGPSQPGPRHVYSAVDANSKNTPETQHTIAHHVTDPTTPPSSYLIRATQGHSMKLVQSADLLSPITLADPSTIPATVVHGTFYGAWAPILASGGLKPMGRNNVHFATGPALDDVLAIVGGDGGGGGGDAGSAMKTKSQVDSVLSQNKVVSGMRWDAQLLIYVDLRRCLEDVAARGLDMTWWRSGNGVILTEGVGVSVGVGVDGPEHASHIPASDPDDVVPLLASRHVKQQRAAEIAGAEQPHPTPSSSEQQPGPEPEPQSAQVPLIPSKHAKQQRAADLASTTPPPPPSSADAGADPAPLLPSQHAKVQYTHVQRQQKLVPLEYWRAVVDIKGGLGVVWTREAGVVRELPERLRGMAVPRGKGRVRGSRGGRGRGKGNTSARPRLNVNDDDDGHGDGDGREDGVVEGAE